METNINSLKFNILVTLNSYVEMEWYRKHNWTQSSLCSFSMPISMPYAYTVCIIYHTTTGIRIINGLITHLSFRIFHFIARYSLSTWCIHFSHLNTLNVAREINGTLPPRQRLRPGLWWERALQSDLNVAAASHSW